MISATKYNKTYYFKGNLSGKLIFASAKMVYFDRNNDTKIYSPRKTILNHILLIIGAKSSVNNLLVQFGANLLYFVLFI